MEFKQRSRKKINKAGHYACREYLQLSGLCESITIGGWQLLVVNFVADRNADEVRDHLMLV
jgi:hypothetical protein